MRIVILGAGGVGSVIGAYLARNGADVIMIARPSHAAAVQRHGLQVSGLADFRTPVASQAQATDI